MLLSVYIFQGPRNQCIENDAHLSSKVVISILVLESSPVEYRDPMVYPHKVQANDIVEKFSR